MKQVFIILGLIAAILATILSVLPLSNLAIFPAIAALIFGLIAFYLSKKAGYVKKIIQFTFLLTILALSITIYKAVFTKVEVTNTEELIIKEEESKQEAIEELEDLDLEDISIE
ncbi:FUSC family protein [Confluentibacter flavum]|uniref:FUSC family protein n=1 Tax=Confluentibacter flavum TaxID=1909700 RepID=A0A2N3HMS0_9FLAO|nr:FUSC family protein [Confluentibacter flavum]PKQ46184.1 FUSC family protein [Confluentibacter flavum]